MTDNLNRARHTEQGNALFLILIAVVLFAALSYAITQSNRSGGQNASNEANQVAGSAITQYPSAMRTGITRMLLAGTGIPDLLFNPPASFSGTTTREVFHPNGGGVSYQVTDPTAVNAVIAVATHATQNWYFMTDKAITNIGTATADIAAFLVDVKSGICQRINNQILGSTAIPTITQTLAQIEAAGAQTLVMSPATAAGQPALCVATSDGTNVYYQVLVEQ